MECGVCLNDWDADNFVPKMLTCGHTYCHKCLIWIYKDKDQIITCPTCCVVHKFENKEAVNALIRNFTLLSLISDRNQPPKKVVEP
jgi:hypothetical protein